MRATQGARTVLDWTKDFHGKEVFVKFQSGSQPLCSQSATRTVYISVCFQRDNVHVYQGWST